MAALLMLTEYLRQNQMQGTLQIIQLQFKKMQMLTQPFFAGDLFGTILMRIYLQETL
jgi:hypothetical protein